MPPDVVDILQWLGAFLAAVPSFLKAWSLTIFHLTPLFVFVLTAGVAIWRFRLYRMGKAAIKIEMEVASRRSSGSFNAISAVAVLTNTGRVVARCSKLVWRVRVLAPYSDVDVDMRVQAYEKHHSVETRAVEFPWSVNYTLTRSDSRIFLEPGEVNTVSMSLAIPDWIESIDVQFYLQEAGSSEDEDAAWEARRSHDIMKEA